MKFTDLSMSVALWFLLGGCSDMSSRLRSSMAGHPRHERGLLSKPGQPCAVLCVMQSHDARVMSAWEAQQAVWQQQARHLAAVAAKEPSQLALTSGK
jgi:hypothetical protein